MLGVTSCVRTVERGRMIVVAIAAIIGLSVLVPTSAHASGCTDSWTNAAGGEWSTGSNWSKGAPPSAEDEACITAAGTYTVTMTQTNTTGSVSVQSLTVGASSGTQTLTVGSSCSLNATLATTGGISNGTHGVITLTNGDGCGESVTVTGPISNSGKLFSEPANGGSRTLQGNLTNKGTFTVNTNTAYDGASTLLSNQGTLKVAEGKQLAVTGGGSVTNGTGGKIAATGSGDLFLKEGTFTEGAGTTSGTKPVIVDDASLSYAAGGGAGPIALQGTSSLSGTSVAGQSLSLQSTCSEHAVVTAASGFANGGTMTLTNGDGCGDNVTLIISTGTLTNSGTLTTETAHGGSRQIQGNLTNTGTLTIGANTSYNGTSTTLTNEGALSVAEAKQLAVAKNTFVNGPGGSISAAAGASVFVSAGTFTQNAGTTSGSEPVIVDDSTLDYTGTGASQIALRGTSSLEGNLGSEQALAIQSTCSEHASVTAAASYTNAGTITFTNGDGCGNNVTLTTSAGTLTNSGKIVTETAHGGSRQIQGNLTNTGTLTFNSFLAYNSTEAALDNEGTLEIAEAKQVTVSGNGTVVNGTGGVISVGKGADLLMGSGTTFAQGAGTTSGGQPVIVDDGTLDYTGTGASQIALRGTSSLEGNIGSEQALAIQSTCSEHASVTAAVSYTNAGTITLTNGDGCGNNAVLTISAGTLTNSGKIVTEPAHGGVRQIQGNLTNTGTIILNANTSESTLGATLLNEGTIDIVENVTFSVGGTATFTNGAGGTIAGTGNGDLVQTGGTFNEGLGAIVGNEPVILDDLTLDYTEHGSGTIALRGTSTLGSGNIKVGETLRIESTCGEHATVSAPSFTNNGTLELTNGDGCGNNATLNLSGGTLTNTNTINVDNPHGGLREIEGNLVNSQFLVLMAGETLQVSGNYTQTSLGKLKTIILSASSFGALTVGGSTALAGKLLLHEVPPFHGELGQTFAIVKSGSLTGEFAGENEGKLNASGLYYKPTYAATGVTLAVTQATLSVAPSSGAPGSSATVSGSGYLPGDTLELKFADHSGVKTLYPSVTVNGSGEFSVEITIPAAAALHRGEVKITSVQTGAKISQGFVVT